MSNSAISGSLAVVSVFLSIATVASTAKKYLESTFQLSKKSPQALGASFLLGSWYMSSTLISIVLNYSTSTSTSTSDNILPSLMRAAFGYAAVTLFFGPFLILTPTSKIILEKDTLFKAFVQGAQSKKARTIFLYLFVFLTAMQGFVVYSLYQVLYDIGSEWTVIIGILVAYALVCLLFLVMFYSVMMQKDVEIGGINLMENIRRHILIPGWVIDKLKRKKPDDDSETEDFDILGHPNYTKLYLFLFILVSIGVLALIITIFVNDTNNFPNISIFEQIVISLFFVINLIFFCTLVGFILNVAFNPVNLSSEVVVGGIVVNIKYIKYSAVYDRKTRVLLGEFGNILDPHLDNILAWVNDFASKCNNDSFHSFVTPVEPWGRLFQINDTRCMYFLFTGQEYHRNLAFYYLTLLNEYCSSQLYQDFPQGSHSGGIWNSNLSSLLYSLNSIFSDPENFENLQMTYSTISNRMAISERSFSGSLGSLLTTESEIEFDSIWAQREQKTHHASIIWDHAQSIYSELFYHLMSFPSSFLLKHMEGDILFSSSMVQSASKMRRKRGFGFSLPSPSLPSISLGRRKKRKYGARSSPMEFDQHFEVDTTETTEAGTETELNIREQPLPIEDLDGERLPAVDDGTPTPLEQRVSGQETMENAKMDAKMLESPPPPPQERATPKEMAGESEELDQKPPKPLKKRLDKNADEIVSISKEPEPILAQPKKRSISEVSGETGRRVSSTSAASPKGKKLFGKKKKAKLKPGRDFLIRKAGRKGFYIEWDEAPLTPQQEENEGLLDNINQNLTFLKLVSLSEESEEAQSHKNPQDVIVSDPFLFSPVISPIGDEQSPSFGCFSISSISSLNHQQKVNYNHLLWEVSLKDIVGGNTNPCEAFYIGLITNDKKSGFGLSSGSAMDSRNTFRPSYFNKFNIDPLNNFSFSQSQAGINSDSRYISKIPCPPIFSLPGETFTILVSPKTISFAKNGKYIYTISIRQIQQKILNTDQDLHLCFLGKSRGSPSVQRLNSFQSTFSTSVNPSFIYGLAPFAPLRQNKDFLSFWGYTDGFSSNSNCKNQIIGALQSLSPLHMRCETFTFQGAQSRQIQGNNPNPKSPKYDIQSLSDFFFNIPAAEDFSVAFTSFQSAFITPLHILISDSSPRPDILANWKQSFLLDSAEGTKFHSTLKDPNFVNTARPINIITRLSLLNSIQAFRLELMAIGLGNGVQLLGRPLSAMFCSFPRIRDAVRFSFILPGDVSQLSLSPVVNSLDDLNTYFGGVSEPTELDPDLMYLLLVLNQAFGVSFIFADICEAIVKSQSSSESFARIQRYSLFCEPHHPKNTSFSDYNLLEKEFILSHSIPLSDILDIVESSCIKLGYSYGMLLNWIDDRGANHRARHNLQITREFLRVTQTIVNACRSIEHALRPI